MGNEILLSNDIIHVTGFGRFRGFTETNPSWEAVSLLPIEIEFNDKKFIIEKHEVAVTYEAVDKIVPALWAQNPKVFIIFFFLKINFSFTNKIIFFVSL